jgi:hypothetical protein
VPAGGLPPWLTPFERWLGPTDPRPGGRLELRGLNAFAESRALALADGRPLRFVEATGDAHLPYELGIAETGCVPTRCTGQGMVHDWFNALCWLRWPAIKARLNRLQADAICAQPESLHGRRGALRDAITLFDENGALLIGATDDVLTCWRSFDWRGLFVERRALFGHRAQVLVVGHALLEKLQVPYKAICAHALAIDTSAETGSNDDAGYDGDAIEDCDVVEGLDRVDAAVARRLDPDLLHRDRLMPLPVLGIPGWWPENADPAFYNDASVFRQGRRRSSNR